MRSFEEYTRALEIPGNLTDKAICTFNATTGKVDGRHYRLRSALDYFLNSYQIPNPYIRLILIENRTNELPDTNPLKLIKHSGLRP